MSYLQATKKEIIVDDVGIQYKRGWTYISKKTKQVVYHSTNIDMLDDQELSTSDIIKIYKNMSNYWNTYRDEINSLVGDISLYYNYKMDLYKIELEEKMIENDIITRENINDNDSNSNIEYF